jgi:hypothetical protein
MLKDKEEGYGINQKHTANFNLSSAKYKEVAVCFVVSIPCHVSPLIL